MTCAHCGFHVENTAQSGFSQIREKSDISWQQACSAQATFRESTRRIQKQRKRISIRCTGISGYAQPDLLSRRLSLWHRKERLMSSDDKKTKGLHADSFHRIGSRRSRRIAARPGGALLLGASKLGCPIGDYEPMW